MTDVKIYLFPVNRIKRIRIKPHDWDSACRCGTCISISMGKIADALAEGQEPDPSLYDYDVKGQHPWEDKDND